MSTIWVEITATRGSAPRDVGTAMKVTAQTTEGTIGGGALEHKAIAEARRMLIDNRADRTETFPLGPGLGQCCGGAVTLLFTRQERNIDPSATTAFPMPSAPQGAQDLWLWGAGHVGRAVVAACPPGKFRITWVDSAADRFPDRVDPQITKIPAADMPRLAIRAPIDAHHLVFTYSHDMDLALCAALLERGFASCGLIGSDTKWARFRKRLKAAGLDPAPITCPIGNKSLGKRPDAIAQGTLQALMRERLTA